MFDEPNSCIKISGSADDISAAQQFINRKYVDVLITDELELQLQGWLKFTKHCFKLTRVRLNPIHTSDYAIHKFIVIANLIPY